MLLRCLAIVPLLAAVAIGQTDRRVIHTEPGFIAEAYGLDLLGQGSMTSRLDVSSDSAGRRLYCLKPDPTPACHQTLLIGADESRLPLAPLGLAGWLLVDSPFISLTVPLREPVHIPTGHHMCGNTIYVQSVTVRPDEFGQYGVSFSHALKLIFYHT